MTDATERTGAQTLRRGLDVIAAVADGARSLAEVSEATGLAKSTAHRLIQLLQATDYVRATAHGYSLGPALIEYGFRALHQNPLPVVARPVIERLSESVLDTVHLAIEDAGEVLYLDKIPGRRGAEMRSRIGHRMPLTKTGIGKALLIDAPARWARLFADEQPGAAYPPFEGVMRACRERDASFDMEENEPGIRCVGAPIRDGRGEIVAAISVSATLPYMPTERMDALVPVVRKAAASISRGLGARAG